MYVKCSQIIDTFTFTLRSVIGSATFTLIGSATALYVIQGKLKNKPIYEWFHCQTINLRVSSSPQCHYFNVSL